MASSAPRAPKQRSKFSTRPPRETKPAPVQDDKMSELEEELRLEIHGWRRQTEVGGGQNGVGLVFSLSFFFFFCFAPSLVLVFRWGDIGGGSGARSFRAVN